MKCKNRKTKKDLKALEYFKELEEYRRANRDNVQNWPVLSPGDKLFSEKCRSCGTQSKRPYCSEKCAMDMLEILDSLIFDFCQFEHVEVIAKVRKWAKEERNKCAKYINEG